MEVAIQFAIVEIPLVPDEERVELEMIVPELRCRRWLEAECALKCTGVIGSKSLPTRVQAVSKVVISTLSRFAPSNSIGVG